MPIAGHRIGLMTGVYLIRNKLNGKVYVGSSARSLRERFQTHKELLRHGKHHSCHLQRAWDKYGSNAFQFLVKERCPPGLCIEREQHWMDHFRSADGKYGYNRSPKAGSSLGTVHTAAAKQHMREARLGKPLSEEHRRNMVASIRARYKDPELRARIARINSARVAQETPEQRAHRCRGIGQKVLSEYHKRRISEGCVGRKHTEETKKKISLVQRGKKLTEAHKAKIAAAGMGRVQTPETRAKMSATKKLRCASPEFRKKMSIVVEKQWEKRRAAHASSLPEGGEDTCN